MPQNKQSTKEQNAQPEQKYPHIPGVLRDEDTESLLSELVAHLRQKRSELREEWALRIQEAELLTATVAVGRHFATCQ